MKRSSKAAASSEGMRLWHYALAIVAALIVVLEVYGPALEGPFVFDDHYLPFLRAEFADAPLRAWVGIRPLLMTSYWLNLRASGLDPYAFHLAGVLLHLLNSVLMFVVLRRILQLAGEAKRRTLLAGIGAGLFLLHPVQTESVAYVASRSETLSLVFFLGALAAFVYRTTNAVGWPRAIAVLLLFAAAVTTKEHTAVLPALLVLTDFYFGGGKPFESIRRNWKLYAPLLVLGAAGGVFVWRVLRSATTAGFAVQDLPWHHYLFTQFRVVWSYVRLFVLPYGQNADYEHAVSRSLLAYGSWFGLLLLLGCAVLAWKHRRAYPLASYGYFVFLLLLAPTSSVVPIKDLMAERRLYLPFLGLLLVLLEFVRRLRLQPVALGTGAAVLLAICSMLSYSRNQVWSSAQLLWEDTSRKSPKNARARFQLAFEYFQQGKCAEAVKHYEATSRLQTPDHRLLVNWGMAHECAAQMPEALRRFEEAAKLQQTGHVYSLIGMVHAKQREFDKAMRSFETAEKVEPAYDMTYVYRAITLTAMGAREKAASEYRRALRINPGNQAAQQGLAALETQAGRQG